jgi:transcriptional regulator with XRE-family HTH domain
MENRQARNIAAAFKSRRQALGLSQARLARLAGLSRATINEFEAGATDLGIAKVLRVGQLLGLSIGVMGASQADRSWLVTAARSASTSYRSPMPPAVLARAIRTGEIDEAYRPHIATFLEESSPAVLVKAVASAFPGKVPKAAWRNVAKMARATMSQRGELA